MLRPLHDVPGAGAAVGGPTCPSRPTYGVFRRLRRFHRASRRGGGLRVILFSDGGRTPAGRFIFLVQMDRRQNTHRMEVAETVYYLPGASASDLLVGKVFYHGGCKIERSLSIPSSQGYIEWCEGQFCFA